MGLFVIVDGQVTQQRNENGRNGIVRKKTVVFGNGEIDVKFESQADYDAFPKQGEQVRAQFSASYVMTEFGPVVKKLLFERCLTPGGAATPSPSEPSGGQPRRMAG